MKVVIILELAYMSIVFYYVDIFLDTLSYFTVIGNRVRISLENMQYTAFFPR